MLTITGILPQKRGIKGVVVRYYSDYFIWIAESFNPDVLWRFRQKRSDYLITYSMTIYYYVDYLSRGSKNLKTEN
jgi:hypothetical protein